MSQTWDEHGMTCQTSPAGIKCGLKVHFVVKATRVYIQLPQDHPHYGCSVDYLNKTYDPKYRFVYSDRNGKIAFVTALEENMILQMTKELCENIWRMNPDNSSRAKFCDELKNISKRANEEKWGNPNLVPESQHLGPGNTAFCPACDNFVSIKDTICKHCAHKFNMWHIPRRNRYWDQQTKKWIYQ